MPDNTINADQLLNHYRSYLLLLARMQLDVRARQQLDASDIAVQLDRTDAAVAGLLHRGLRKLRELMTEKG